MRVTVYSRFLFVLLSSSAALYACAMVSPVAKRKKNFCFIYMAPNVLSLKERPVPPFQISFIEGDILSPLNISLPYDIPYLGYYGDPYYWRDELALIRFAPLSVFNVIPKALRRALAVHLGVRARALSETLKTKQVTFMALAQGLAWRQQSAEEPLFFNKPLNAMYHMWAGQWHTVNDNLVHYSENIALGIFKASGVGPAVHNSITFNSLTSQHVCWHNAFSPNNACFVPIPERAFSAFWILAVSQDKNHIHCGLFLVANTKAAHEMLEQVFHSANTVSEVHAALEHITKHVAPEDSEALRYWAEAIVIALHEGAPPPKQIADNLGKVPAD